MLSSGGIISQSSSTSFIKLPAYSRHLRGSIPSRHGFSSIQNRFMRWNLNYAPRARVCVQCRGAKEVEVRNGNENENVQKREEDDVGRNMRKKKKLAVFVSGGGSNFRALHQASLDHQINGEFSVLVTDKPSCRASEYARESNIPTIIFPKGNNELSGLSPADLITTLRHFEIDFLLLAGYLKLIPFELVQAFPRSILNIHPSLLPAFGGKGYYGMKVHRAVIASGARFSGPTIHFVDEKYDTGKILAQRVVPVLVSDTTEDLAARVLQEEHSLYVEVVAALCEDQIFWRVDGVPIIRKSFNSDQYY